MRALVQLPLAEWFDAPPTAVRPLGDGHINATYDVRTPHGRWVLQALSPEVFRDPGAVIANQQAATAHLATLAETGAWAYQVPTLVPTLAGEYAVLHDGRCWRLCLFIGPGRTFTTLPGAAAARAAGRAFADLQQALALLPTAAIQPVIAGFHQLDHYAAQLQMAWDDTANRSQDATLDLLHAHILTRTARYGALPAAPASLIHGDCKVNNLRFAPRGSRVVGLLDFDTLMLGQWWWDFGDLVRSAAAPRTGTDTVNEPVLAALIEGFFGGRTPLTVADRQQALAAPGYMTFMLCMRFFTDHLNGDRYFRVTRRGDNLARAQAQWRWLEILEHSATQERMAALLDSGH